MDDWKSLYGPIYSLDSVKLETLKVYIKNNLANSFIKLFQFFARTYIFFNQKPAKSLNLYMNYWSLNNLIIENRYSLSLVEKLLDQLGQAQYFTQFDLTNTYYQIKIQENNK